MHSNFFLHFSLQQMNDRGQVSPHANLTQMILNTWLYSSDHWGIGYKPLLHQQQVSV